MLVPESSSLGREDEGLELSLGQRLRGPHGSTDWYNRDGDAEELADVVRCCTSSKDELLAVVSCGAVGDHDVLVLLFIVLDVSHRFTQGHLNPDLQTALVDGTEEVLGVAVRRLWMVQSSKYISSESRFNLESLFSINIPNIAWPVAAEILRPHPCLRPCDLFWS